MKVKELRAELEGLRDDMEVRVDLYEQDGDLTPCNRYHPGDAYMDPGLDTPKHPAVFVLKVCLWEFGAAKTVRKPSKKVKKP